MKIQASSAIENGFTTQLTNSVTPMPRQCCRTSPQRAEVHLQQHRDDHQPDQQPDRQVDLATSMRPIAWNSPGKTARRDADHDAGEDPDRQVALEDAHRRAGGLPGRDFTLDRHRRPSRDCGRCGPFPP